MESAQIPPASPIISPDTQSTATTDFRQENPFAFSTEPKEIQNPRAAADSNNPTDRTDRKTTLNDANNEDLFDAENPVLPSFTRPVKEKVLLEWSAPSRPFKKHNRQVFSTIGVIGLLIGLILFFAGQVIPVAVVFAAIFLIYVMFSTPPTMVVHKLTTHGIRVEKTIYYWDEMGRFWFTDSYGIPVLHIEIDRFPNRLTLLIGDIQKDDMEELLSQLLLNEIPPLTAYEKASKWLREKLPIDLGS